jgi:ribosome silencing factor RsfS/YbeB/iojap
LNTTRTRKPAVADVVAAKPARFRAKPSVASPIPAAAGAVRKSGRSKVEADAGIQAAKPARSGGVAASTDATTVAPKRKPALTASAKPATSSRSTKAAAVKPKSAAAAKSARAPAAVLAPQAKPVVRRSTKSKASEPTIDRVVRDAVVARLDAMKAHDLKVIDVRDKTSVTDFLVIVSGTSTRHVKSMGDEVVVTAKKFGMPPMGIEGEKDAEWMLVDLGDTVVHLMLPKVREFYGLERLWTLAGEARAAAFLA